MFARSCTSLGAQKSWQSRDCVVCAGTRVLQFSNQRSQEFKGSAARTDRAPHTATLRYTRRLCFSLSVSCSVLSGMLADALCVSLADLSPHMRSITRQRGCGLNVKGGHGINSSVKTGPTLIHPPPAWHTRFLRRAHRCSRPFSEV